jgi:hypothetical protein
VTATISRDYFLFGKDLNLHSGTYLGAGAGAILAMLLVTIRRTRAAAPGA